MLIYTVLLTALVAWQHRIEAFHQSPSISFLVKSNAIGNSKLNSEKEPLEVIGDSFNIFFDRIRSGDNFKQSVADALAGSELDVDNTKNEILNIVNSSPLVLFTWTMSPACKKAIKLLEDNDVTMKIVELNKPWNEGNKIRATLGRITGRTSVPSIWLNGKFIGGYEDGLNKEAPGLVPLAFSGKLRPMLIDAGVLQPVDGIDGTAKSSPSTSSPSTASSPVSQPDQSVAVERVFIG